MLLCMDTRSPTEVEKGASVEIIHLDHLPKVARDALKRIAAVRAATAAGAFWAA